MFSTLGMLALIAGVALFFYQKRDRITEFFEKMVNNGVQSGQIRGLVIGPITMVGIRYIGVPIFCFMIVSVFFWLVILVSPLTGPTQLQLLVSLILTAILTSILILPDEKLTVTINTVAPLTFFGTLYRVYLGEGDYNWWLRKFFVDRSKVTLRDFTTRKKDEVKDAAGRIINPQEDGFFKITPVPFTLFNTAKDADGAEERLINGVTKNGSPVDAELLITLQTFDPHLAIRNDDPGLEIAERARSMFRTCIGFFMSVDTAVAKDSMAHLIEGKTMVVAFTHSSINSLPEGSIVRDTGGEPTYRIVNITSEDAQGARTSLGEEASEDAIVAGAKSLAEKRVKEEYTKHLDVHLTAQMRKGVCISKAFTKSDGSKGRRASYIIETRSVKVGLTEILAKNGFELTSASVGKVVIAPTLSTSAVAAEQQNFENAVQVSSAKATAMALGELDSSAIQMADPAYLDKLAIAASSDPTGRAGFQRVSTDNRLATVGVAAAALQKGNENRTVAAEATATQKGSTK